jgi:hydroxymethylglutaryl-CoA lyase
VQDRLEALGFETGLDRTVVAEAAEMARAMRGGAAAAQDKESGDV